MTPKHGKYSHPQASAQHKAVAVATKMQQAVTLHQHGQLAQAHTLYEEILLAEPKHVDALNLLGVLAAQTGNLQKASDLISSAIALKPDYVEAYCNLGNVLQNSGQLEKALANYDQAIVLKPGYAEAYYGRGITLKGLKQLEAAVSSYNQAIALNPRHEGALYNRGNVLKELGQFNAAIASYDAAIALRPNNINAYFNRGLAHYGLKQFEAAITSYGQAIALKPDDADAYYNRGVALSALGKLEAAVADYDNALQLKPSHVEIYVNRGIALKGLGRLNEAQASYDKALSLEPNNVKGHWNQALLRLLQGDFARGWEEYEWRWQLDTELSWVNALPQPLWLGSESLAGKTILLHSEQGLGDTIQFCRYAKLVAELGAKVILIVPQPLVDLLKRLDGVTQVVAKGSALPPFDYHCPLLSLPLAFKTELKSIPSPRHYLTSDAGRVAHWQTRLAEKNRARVGLVWCGSTTQKNDPNRNILLAEIIPHLPKHFQYVSLQKEVRDADRQTRLSHPDILHFENELNDFGDTAALCELMDIIISVDTSVAHLAGALGKLVWILLPFDPAWRWLLDRTDNPWYTSAKLYRQNRIGDWQSTFQQVKDDLAGIY
jgi:tetratricopeptide (TPR) repeat protein